MKETQEKTQPNEHTGDRQIVALNLGDEVYGIDIAIIHTVIMPQSVTAVPKTPKYVKGVMNLRGRILPIIDLRTRFDLPPLKAEEQKSVRVVIVDVEGISAGLIVDAVSEVLTLPSESIEPQSGLIASKESEFITGIGRIQRANAKGEEEDQLIMLLDVLEALTATTQDLNKIKKLQQAA